ncbi:MAG: NAD(P)/FAD-dependent oxidoreductase [Kiritimatiellia bacterium]|jgi:glycerol-3-phosphate dehydrogenase
MNLNVSPEKAAPCDVLVIGAGVVGCAVARALSHKQARVIVLEAGEDVANGASKANSAIIHSGHDAKSGTQKAFHNVRGNALFEPLCRELGVPFRRNGSLVVAFSEEEKATLATYVERGRVNGVPGLEILDREALLAREPNLSPEAVAALWAPTGGICCPYELTFRLAENAAANGAAFRFETPVTGLTREDGSWRIETRDGGVFFARAVVNAAGSQSAKLNNLVSARHYEIEPRRGEYLMIDKSEAGTFQSTLFMVPTSVGKGVLVSPTVDNTLIVGPTNDPIPDATDKATTAAGLAKLQATARRLWPTLPMRKVIAAFSGIRAHEETGGDFVIGEAPDAPLFFNALGIESPGLVASPSIAETLVADIAAKLGLEDKPAAAISTDTSQWPHIRDLSPAALADVVRRDPAYGRVVCRCETVSEGEIRASIRARVGARTVDGIKRRTRATMGRCQGGFCTPRLLEILAEELGIRIDEVTKCGGASNVVVGPLFEAGEPEAGR